MHRERSRLVDGGGPRAVILSAGRGSRLLPLTEAKPKCLIEIEGKSILEWQIDALVQAGVHQSTVVVGFGADQVIAMAQELTTPQVRIRTIVNPLFDVADNLVSCWTAREEMHTDFLLLNGDTLFEPAVVERLLASRYAPVTVAMTRKSDYDEDDMKVRCDGNVLRKIGKGLPLDETDGESIGMLLLRGTGAAEFRRRLEAAIDNPQATNWYYLSIINEMAAEGMVRVAPVDGLQWAEVDFLHDLDRAQTVVEAWANRPAAMLRRA
ncbi:MAG TPA: phosphocholine cytidylyltransferase family protein [Terriglobales bacterium]|nr:phosphocholine cytidylyltransferase family protein [Terriglobales bacterium]